MKTETLFNVAAIKLCTEAEGPFKRMAIWFQGCDVCCEGCCNPEMIPLVSKNLISLEGLMNVITESRCVNSIEGVTFLGGEPTLQKDLSHLASAIQNTGLGIILFTGRQYEDLNQELKKHVDLMIDGPFQKADTDERNVIGSSNQRIIDVTGRYKDKIDWFLERRGQCIEISIADRDVCINGSVMEKMTFS